MREERKIKTLEEQYQGVSIREPADGFDQIAI